MALLRWIHLRKLMPIEDLIAGSEGVRPATPPKAAALAPTGPAQAGPSTERGPP